VEGSQGREIALERETSRVLETICRSWLELRQYSRCDKKLSKDLNRRAMYSDLLF
jgi:hypothetical protein